MCKTELANDTICSLICAKQNQNMECYEYCPDSEVLKKALTLIGVLLFQMENNVYSVNEVFFDLFQMENNVCSVNEVCFALHTVL
jgi:hypothetical protein